MSETERARDSLLACLLASLWSFSGRRIKRGGKERPLEKGSKRYNKNNGDNPISPKCQHTMYVLRTYTIYWVQHLS